MNVVKDYTISRRTMALIHQPTEQYRTTILEPNHVIHTTKSPLQLIKEACIEGGATYHGRKIAMEKMLNRKSKLPIPIFPTDGVFFFPNRSPKDSNCTWFSFFHINDYTPYGNDITKSIITFSDNTKKVINTSYSSISRQYALTGLEIALLYKRVLWTEETEVRKTKLPLFNKPFVSHALRF